MAALMKASEAPSADAAIPLMFIARRPPCRPRFPSLALAAGARADGGRQSTWSGRRPLTQSRSIKKQRLELLDHPIPPGKEGRGEWQPAPPSPLSLYDHLQPP